MTTLLLTMLLPAGGPGLVSSEFVFESAPFPSCHASTIAEAKSGLVAAWFGGQDEKAPDVGIWLSRSVEGKWTAPVEVADGVQPDGSRHPCWNPVLLPHGGRLLLFYKVGPDPSRWWGMLKRSDDDGKTWSSASRLPDGILGPIKNKPILVGGDILAPSSTEHPETDAWRVHFERSGDGGLTWERTPDVAFDGATIDAIQPSVLTHPGGKLQAVGRTRQKRVFETWSGDGGRTWGKMTLTALPNPNAGTDAVTLADGRHLIVYNHTERGRSPLNVAVSDDGKTWKAALVLEGDPGEYSYPAAIPSGDGLVHVTYTWKRKKIKHVTIDPKRLELRDMPGGRWPG